MLTLVTPLWLAGWALLPLIRWLHRGGRHRRTVPVSRLALWRGSAASSPAAGERRPPDPAWRRRALLAALLFIALAQPQWLQQRQAITLWVDDSLSMLTREAQGTRLAAGLAQARALLAADAEVEMRALGDPWRNLGALTDVAAAAVTAGAGRIEPSAPPAALLRSDRLHWLLTDGADAALLQWPVGAGPDRVIQVGRVTRNVGLQRLSARRDPDDPGAIELLLKVVNGGTAAERREVVFTGDAGELARSAVALEPGRSAFVSAKIPAAARVRATLQPGDALADDDELVLDLAPLRRRRIAVDAKCPATLAAAVAAHPALSLAVQATNSASAVDAALDCGTPGAAREMPTLQVLADRAPSKPQGAVLWSDSVAAAQRVPLDLDRLRLAAPVAARPGDDLLLAIGDEPVIVQRAGAARRIETSLDFASMAATPGPEIPLLLNFAFGNLLGTRLLEETAITDRGPAASLVAPALMGTAAGSATGARAGPDRSVAAAPERPRGPRQGHDASWPVLLAALLVLLWEVVALGLQWRRLGAGAGAGAGSA
jgi:hypothetical protein